MTAVFTYGSLMFEPVWRHAVGDAPPPCVAAIISGFARYRVSGQLYPCIVRADGQQVTGTLYQSVTDAQLKLLDEFEETAEGMYERIEVEAFPDSPDVGATSVKAFAYLYLSSDGIDPVAWDPNSFFERDMQKFIREYP